MSGSFSVFPIEGHKHYRFSVTDEVEFELIEKVENIGDTVYIEDKLKFYDYEIICRDIYCFLEDSFIQLHNKKYKLLTPLELYVKSEDRYDLSGHSVNINNFNSFIDNYCVLFDNKTIPRWFGDFGPSSPFSGPQPSHRYLDNYHDNQSAQWLRNGATLRARPNGRLARIKSGEAIWDDIGDIIDGITFIESVWQLCDSTGAPIDYNLETRS